MPQNFDQILPRPTEHLMNPTAPTENLTNPTDSCFSSPICSNRNLDQSLPLPAEKFGKHVYPCGQLTSPASSFAFLQKAPSIPPTPAVISVTAQYIF